MAPRPVGETGFDDLVSLPKSLKEKVLPILREAIIDGTLPPGTRLSEAGLSRRLAVSRSPIREALLRLQGESLVVMIPHVGSFVREWHREEVEGLYQVRTALETLAVLLAAEKSDAPSRKRLSEVVEEMKEAASAGDSTRYAADTDRFHGALLQMSNNPSLVRAYQALSGPVRRIRRVALGTSERLSPSLDQHVLIADAVLGGRADEASARMRAHLDEAASVALAALPAPRSQVI